MTTIKLTRFDYSRSATLGRLEYLDGWCYTLEDPWNDNRVGVSCIPEGWYLIRRDTFRGQYPNFRVDGVVGRTAIEMHAGNTAKDTKGCILLGSQVVMDLASRVTYSRAAFDTFMKAMSGVDEATLIITRN